MSWLKKTFHKVKKHVKRVSHGKFHIGHDIESMLPKRYRKSFDKLRWSKLVKGRLMGNNSASTVYAGYADPGSSGYMYHGRTLSELM